MVFITLDIFFLQLNTTGDKFIVLVQILGDHMVLGGVTWFFEGNTWFFGGTEGGSVMANRV